MNDETTQLIAKGGGWYYPVGGDPDDDKLRFSKKALKAGGYQVVEAEEPAAAETGDEIVAPSGPLIAPSSAVGATDEQIAQADLNKWGPFKEYQFVTTPYGEFGVPAGRTIERFEQATARDGRRYMKPVYGGKDRTRTDAEIAELRAAAAERDQLVD